MPDSKLISDSVTIFLVAVAFRSDFGTTLDFCLGSSIDRAVMRGSISGLLEEGSSELIRIFRIDGSWVSSEHWIEASKGLGKIARIEFACFGRIIYLLTVMLQLLCCTVYEVRESYIQSNLQSPSKYHD